MCTNNGTEIHLNFIASYFKMKAVSYFWWRANGVETHVNIVALVVQNDSHNMINPFWWKCQLREYYEPFIWLNYIIHEYHNTCMHVCAHFNSDHNSRENSKDRFVKLTSSFALGFIDIFGGLFQSHSESLVTLVTLNDANTLWFAEA